MNSEYRTLNAEYRRIPNHFEIPTRRPVCRNAGRGKLQARGRALFPARSLISHSFLLLAERYRTSWRWQTHFLAVHPRPAGIRPELVDYQRLCRSLARGKHKTVNGMRHVVAPFFSKCTRSHQSPPRFSRGPPCAVFWHLPLFGIPPGCGILESGPYGGTSPFGGSSAPNVFALKT